MADDIENTAAEALAPPPPPGCGLCWAYAEDGRPVDAGSAFCTVEDELRFTCSDGPPFSLSYHDILSAEVTALELRLGLREGGFTLSKMGRLHDSFCAAFMERWTTVNRKQALSEEELVASFRGRARRNNGAALSCGVRVFATAIVLDFEDGKRIPSAAGLYGSTRRGKPAFHLRAPRRNLGAFLFWPRDGCVPQGGGRCPDQAGVPRRCCVSGPSAPRSPPSGSAAWWGYFWTAGR